MVEKIEEPILVLRLKAIEAWQMIKLEGHLLERRIIDFVQQRLFEFIENSAILKNRIHQISFAVGSSS